ncbi:histidine kinase [Erythrobacter sp. QSSC1-22B]|uniref:XrtA/PEP-CTERM system histidine kinase PrsK n=1 Tax=Erythrobacter sp. QSSC1-22B TaxID=1860125 RepID=UPI000804B32F|nr:XrtA/PEP-CTERM system histidine kinase PrsK [Erythrobacter sp. QSSC1-22B]OBX18300.1 histidine kinase [Erythrobacter sp. QSSC1-22B]
MAALIAFIAFGIAALACIFAVVWIARSSRRDRSDRMATLVALLITALWCLAVAALGADRSLARFAETARDLAWTIVLFRLFANDGRDASLQLVRPVIGALVFVQFLQVVVIVIGIYGDADREAARTAFETLALFHILVAAGALVLLHNLYAGASEMSRRLLAWSSGALALFWAFELNYHTVVYLGGGALADLNAMRGLIMAGMACGIAVGFSRSGRELTFRPSRAVTFQLLSLVLIGAYFAAMVLLSDWAARFSGDLGRITQVGFLLAAAAFAVLWLPSQRVRDWLRVMATKHLFKHRYDYRAEWLRFTHTIGRPTGVGGSLWERAIQSLADITDSPCGLLLVPDEDGALTLAARWRWPQIEVPAPALPLELGRLLEREGLIVDLDESRKGISHHGEVAMVPSWLLEETLGWAAVPLNHHDRLVGVIILGRPTVHRGLDWEDFDLLGVAGKQVASYLAEQTGQEALEEARRFDEFNRRMAFVMHDIKNLSSQMALLLANAEKHADNPEFRKDMLITLRNSSDKLNALLARLGRYGGTDSGRRERIDLVELGRSLVTRFARTHPFQLLDNGRCPVLADSECLEQALIHLVQNAIDASASDAPVQIEIRNEGLRGTIVVADTGRGMSAPFVRNELFKPFVSTKEGGFGIGAHEARVMIRAMGGRLDVESREGFGSRFAISLPTDAAEKLLAARSERSSSDEFEIAATRATTNEVA